VVNKSVADKAVSVKADELIRKPFQPQELINRVKVLLEPKTAAPAPALDRGTATSALTSFFAPMPAIPRTIAPPPAPPTAQEPAWPRALAQAFAPRPPAAAQAEAQASAATPFRQAPSASELQKLRVEIARLEMLIKKLQTELQIERQYNQALETQIQALTQAESS
jgi:DNA-binding response OmpR family regulator